MKKSLLALAALAAFAGTASAQSAVTLYGLVDLHIQHLRSGDASPLAGGNTTRLMDGGFYGPGSRWGLRVSEDLGSGLKANVVLESGFSADTGNSSQGGRLFGRQAFVSLASEAAGEIRLGRQYILHDEVLVVTNPFGNTTLMHPGSPSDTFATGAVGLFIDAPRIDNAVQYLSPTFGGFRVQGMVAAGEGAQDRYQGVKGTYTAGPLNAALSYEQSKARIVAPGGASDVNKILEIGANYDFGFFRLFGGYQRGKDLTTGVGTQLATLAFPGLAGTATGLKAYTIGVSKAFGAFNVGANYSRSQWENAAGADRTLGRIGVAATYSLSKQTTVYAGVGVANGDLKQFINEKQVFQLGLRKAF